MKKLFLILALLLIGTPVSAQVLTVDGSPAVTRGTVCPPTATPVTGAGSLYLCTTGAGYVWDGGSWVSLGGSPSGEVTLGNGLGVKTDTTDAHTGLLQVYDVDGAAYATALLLTNGNIPQAVWSLLGQPNGKSPITLAGGDDGGGSSALVIDNASDQYIVERYVQDTDVYFNGTYWSIQPTRAEATLYLGASLHSGAIQLTQSATDANTAISASVATGGTISLYAPGGVFNVTSTDFTVSGLGDVTTIGIVAAAGYKSADGTAGATVTTCTGFKNGLCVSGT